MWVTTAEFPEVQGLRGHQHSLPALGISGQIFGTKTHPGSGTKSCTALYKDGPSISLLFHLSLRLPHVRAGSRWLCAEREMANGCLRQMALQVNDILKVTLKLLQPPRWLSRDSSRWSI